MVWLETTEWENQKYIDLRLNASENEKIVLEFNPLKLSDAPDWNPMWEEWHCYAEPLRIYKSDYEMLVEYFNKVYPTKDAFDGTEETVFDICSFNWIGKSDWQEIEEYIRCDIDSFPNDKKDFMSKFLDWLDEALNHTDIIVVEGNL